MKFKDLFKYLFYFSLLFLAVKLYRDGFLHLPLIHSVFSFAVSILFLFAGFLCTAAGWGLFLKLYGVNTGFKDAVISTGLPVFTKYIPGSIWSVIGGAEYVTSRHGISRQITFTASFGSQMLSLFTGFVLALLSLLVLPRAMALKWGPIVGALVIVSALVLFSSHFRKLVNYTALKILKKNIDMPAASSASLIRLMPVYFFMWLLFSLFFYFYAQSVSLQTVPLFTAAGFPLAGVFGIVAVFAPGGLGVREGIMTFYLKALGFTIPEAASIALGSRGVFIIGEFFIFALAVIFRYLDKRGEPQQTN